MHYKRIRKFSLYPSAQAVLFVRPTPWDGEQAARLIDDDKRIVNCNDR